MVRYRYNQQINPPAPFVHVILATPDGNRTTAEIPAQIDSGADKSVIPTTFVKSLDLIPCRSVQAAGLGHHVISLDAYIVQVTLKNTTPVAAEVLASDNENHMLLGRDILNHFRVILDDPHLLVDVETSKPST